ncbi:Uncharacterized protein GBIM_07843 [Gryllus bimaculatus]|nr:Uncharacterized protein GBIM_07843 [Gryllus bimaculatus]
MQWSNFIPSSVQSAERFEAEEVIIVHAEAVGARISELKEFCDLTVKTIGPSVVLASGDLTDAKTSDNMGSRQFIQEWELYRQVLDECNVMQSTVWLDIRGNHDNFNVPSLHSKENFYRNYSIQGQKHQKSYLYQVQKGGVKYSFIGMDACLDPGPRRPFNFVGVLTLTEMENLKRLVMEGREHGSNYVIWFGHYPTSCILSPGSGIRALMSSAPEALVYLCGHFHMLGGLVPNMYTLQHGGFLELELGDWKDNRIYRLAAIDHGIFSFVDIPHREWPAVLVTNPKHALYAMPTREALDHISVSTHIRVLAFSLSAIKRVHVRIDGRDWQSCSHIEGPLYTTFWNPREFLQGIHTLEVYVEDEHGREKMMEQPFSLDGSRMSFKLLPRIALMCNVSMVFQFLFGTSLVVCVVPLCVFKFLNRLAKVGKMEKPNIPVRCIRRWVRKLWVLATVDRIFYPLVLYPLYLTIGPWSIGEIIEGHTGIIFAWGTIVNGSYLPGSFTYAYGFLQMCSFQFPLTLFLANCLDQRLTKSAHCPRGSLSRRLCRHLPFAVLVMLQMIFAYFFWLAYGTMAFILGPLRTWSVLLALLLWQQANSLPRKFLQEAAIVWNIGNSQHCQNEEEYECAGTDGS